MRFLGKLAARFAMAMVCWVPWVMRMRSDEWMARLLAVSSLRMAMRLPPAVMWRSSAMSSMLCFTCALSILSDVVF